MAHYLKNIIDPRGTLALRNEYDDGGRLVAQLDAAGHPVEFVRDEANVEKIVDRLGYVTHHEYDGEGNVTRTVRADGTVLLYAYDDPANPTSVTAQTDPLGNVTRYTYDAAGRVLTQTDPLGRVTFTTYDERGNPLTVTDARGNITRNQYHPADAPRGARGQPLSLTDAAGNSTEFTEYDQRGNLRAFRDASGAVTRSNYDALDRLLIQTDAAGNTTTYTYDDAGRVETETRTVTRADLSTQTLVTRYQYDGEGRLTRTYLPGHSAAAPRYTGTDYDNSGKPVALTDESGRVTTHDYDERGFLVRTTPPPVIIDADASGAPLSATYAEEFAYDPEGRRILAKDRADRWTRTCYDSLGRVIATYHLGDSVRTRAQALVAAPGAGTLLSAARYDAAGRVSDTYDALGNRTAYSYDAAGRRTRVTPPGPVPAQFTVNAAGDTLIFARDGDLAPVRATVTTYDETGNVATVTDARGHTTRYLYDNLNRRTETILPDLRRLRDDYDALGRRVESIDAEGRVTRYGYDALGRLTSVTDARLQTTGYGYDEAGRQTTQTDALGRVTRYAYDEQGRRVSRTLPDGKTERYFYDEAGRLERRVDFNGEETRYLHDEHDRLVLRTPSPAARLRGALKASFSYGPTGRRLTQRLYDAADQFVWWENYDYDERDRLETKRTPIGSLGYTHDAQGNLASLATTHGADLTYYYDTGNRLDSVEDRSHLPVGAFPRTTDYAYNAVGALEAVALPNGVASVYAYDSRNQLTDLVAAVNDSTLASFRYTLRASGRRSFLDERIGATQVAGAARRTAWSHDEVYRLTGETVTAGAGDPVATLGNLAYTYDAVGNRLTRVSGNPVIASRTNAFSVRDWLVGDSYDWNGNTLVGQNAGAGLIATTTDHYDDQNRLVQRTESGAGGRTITVLYDADGNRVRKSVTTPGAGTVTTYFLVDTLNPTGYAQVVEEHTQVGAGPITLSKSYAYGLDLISVSNHAGGQTTRRYYGYDGLGSVRYLTDETGALTDRYYYDAFGVLLHHAGTSDNVYLYAGEQWDPDLGLYYNRARYLNPDSGRFWSQDSFEGVNAQPQSLHKYLYAHADPVNGIDPSGHMTLTELGISSLVSGILSAGIKTYQTWGDGGPDWGEVGSSFVTGAATGLVGGVAFNLAGKVIGPLAKATLQPLLQRIGNARPLLLTGRQGMEKLLVRMSRFFINSSKGYPTASQTVLGQFMIRVFGGNWANHHMIIRQAFTSGGPNQIYSNLAANEGLRRLGNGLWNLVPMPQSWHVFYHANEAVANQVIAGVFMGLASAGAHEFIQEVFDE